jgi:tetratricopeptide (TPR) repeat protein
MSATPDQILAAGLAHHRAGDLPAAARSYHQVLQRANTHAEAWHLLGLVHAQSGDHANALVLINRALALDPRHAEAHYNLGNLHRQLDEPAAAAACYRCAIDADPAMAKAFSNLGATLRTLGDIPGAIDACRQALAIDPGRIEAQYNLGCALQHADRLDEAIAAYRAVLARQPRHGDAQANLGLALMRRDRPAEALPVLQTAARLMPGAEAQIALSSCLIALGGFAPALTAAEAATRLAPEDAAAWLQLGLALRECGRSDAAFAAYDRALALAPQSADVLVAQAAARQEHGAGEAAAACVAQALAIDPAHAGAWSLRVGLKRFAADDPDIAALETLASALCDQPERREDLIAIEFALAKTQLDCGTADAAFTWLDRANRHHRARIDYDVQADIAQMAATADAFATVMPGGDATQRPIFIVGMPRSGTTLVEQILGSHPAIHGGGEMKHLDLVLMEHCCAVPDPARLAAFDRATRRRLARDYHARATADAPQGLRVTDKMPSNFRHAGLIHRLFPGAVIVHCRRVPQDTCLSIYATRFAQGQHFGYDLGELGAYYRAYRTLMAHWRHVLPGEVLIEVDYEAVVADLEGQARRLIAACGLPWDDACLAFHRTRRPVRTASVNQVRQPLYTSSVERWRAYARHLEPLNIDPLRPGEDSGNP